MVARPHERLALVAIDSLAEVVLYRHMQFNYGASEDMGGRLAIRRGYEPWR